MGECYDANLIASDVIDDAVRKLSHREPAATIFPERSEFRVLAKKGDYSLEFSD
jgi:hypothetical protein